jgi:uncharacterized protein (TIGR00156 family)
LPDDTWVTTQGYIVRALGDEMYLFKDDSGQIRIEIENDLWRRFPEKISDKDLVEIEGEFDSDGRDEIDVKRIMKVQQ